MLSNINVISNSCMACKDSTRTRYISISAQATEKQHVPAIDDLLLRDRVDFVRCAARHCRRRHCRKIAVPGALQRLSYGGIGRQWRRAGPVIDRRHGTRGGECAAVFIHHGAARFETDLGQRNAAALPRGSQRVVPGTSMVLAVPMRPSATTSSPISKAFPTKPAPAESSILVPTSSAQSANWRLDAPGRVHRISANSLPPPFATPSSRNSSSVVPKPSAPPCRCRRDFTSIPSSRLLTGPRKMLVASNGDILVTEMRADGSRCCIPPPTAAASPAPMCICKD